MDYITIVAPTYEEAVRKARDQYGDRLRIHSRKDVVSKGFFGLRRNRHCELTCFLAEEQGYARMETPNERDGMEANPSRYTSQPRKTSSNKPAVKGACSNEEGDEIEESDIRRFEQEAKTPDPVSGRYRESDMPISMDGDGPSVGNGTVESKGNDKPDAPEGRGEDASGDDASGEWEGNVALDESEAAKGSETSVFGKGKDQLEALVDHARRLLYENDFSSDYIDWITEDLRAQLEPVLPAVPSKDEFELLVVDRIVGSVEIDHNSQLHPPRVFVLVGPTGVGKTTTIAKIAAVYGTLPPEGIRRKVSIITMDSFRVGAYEQIENFGKALGIQVYRADDEAGFYEALERTQDSELVLVDTIGKSPRDGELNVKMHTMLNVPDKKNLKCYLTVSASMKRVDLDNVFEQFSSYGISSVIVTKTDETQTIGNILSICHSKSLPLLFVTDGQKVPRDIHKASSAFMLSLLKGFNMDFNSLWNTQIGSDE